MKNIMTLNEIVDYLVEDDLPLELLYAHAENALDMATLVNWLNLAGYKVYDWSAGLVVLDLI